MLEKLEFSIHFLVHPYRAEVEAKEELLKDLQELITALKETDLYSDMDEEEIKELVFYTFDQYIHKMLILRAILFGLIMALISCTLVYFYYMRT